MSTNFHFPMSCSLRGNGKMENTKATSIADGNVKIYSFTRIIKYFMVQKYFFEVRNKTKKYKLKLFNNTFFAVDYFK